MNNNLNIKTYLLQAFPEFLQKERTRDFFYSALKKVESLINDSITVLNFGQENSSFYQFTLFIQKFLRFNAQTVYLEKYLNDLYSTGASYPYSPTNNAIYINNEGKKNIYSFNIDEPNINFYSFNIWRSTTTYIINDYLLYENKIYKSLQNSNLNKTPNIETTFWEYVKEVNYIFESGEGTTVNDYIINIPNSVVYDVNKFKSEVNQYNNAGKTYTLNNY